MKNTWKVLRMTLAVILWFLGFCAAMGLVTKLMLLAFRAGWRVVA